MQVFIVFNRRSEEGIDKVFSNCKQAQDYVVDTLFSGNEFYSKLSAEDLAKEALLFIDVQDVTTA